MVKEDFDLGEILSLNFNLVKINSINEYNENNLDSINFKELYDLPNLKFKDYIITREELKKIRPYDVFKLPEKIEWDNYYDYYFDFQKKNPNSDYSHLKIKLNELELKLGKKETELFDLELYKKLNFSKLCMHFYFFHEIMLNDTVFFTNFLRLMNGIGIEIDSKSNNFTFDYESLQHYSLEDMFENDYYRLFSILLPVYQWKKK